MEYEKIATIYNNFNQKFGIPRQGGLTEIRSEIVFEKAFRDPDYVKGMEGFSHLWLIWDFSLAQKSDSPTVRPPRLGGNQRVGVFATRAPYRPNPIGLTLVKLLEIKDTDKGKVLVVSGADLVNGTPIIDIKPYLEYTDRAESPSCGFAETAPQKKNVVFLADVSALPREYLSELNAVLSYDPRPAYHDDPERVYGISFGKYDVKFKVGGDEVKVLELKEI